VDEAVDGRPEWSASLPGRNSPVSDIALAQLAGVDVVAGEVLRMTVGAPEKGGDSGRGGSRIEVLRQ
jgi:hypothetical protein